jgi:tRNA dimethylallyltransferase
MDRVPVVAQRLIAIVGPTGAGKTALALRLAERVPAEIVSCDSLQVYRGFDIGSAKPSREERGRVPHHLIDVADPEEGFSAARYAALARAALDEIRGRGRLPVVVGGTGLYLRALLQGLFPGPSRDAELRRRLEALARRHGDARLHRLLAHVDPASAARIQVGDRLRIVRALEVFRATGRPLSEQQRGDEAPLAGPRCIVGLAPPREELRQRVEARTRAMLRAGLLDEVRGLLARGLPPDAKPLQAIGDRQVVALVRDGVGVELTERGIVTETMRYAKRQMTWFRHQTPDVRWHVSADDALDFALSWLRAPVLP